MRRAAYGNEVYGIGPPERLVALHEELLSDVRWRLEPPMEIRHLWKLVLGENEPASLSSLPPGVARRLRERRQALRRRISNEGYTRPATLYVEGLVEGA